eukprot:GSMAST32.ASY1.ANO1.2277.1 assembled CDS
MLTFQFLRMNSIIFLTVYFVLASGEFQCKDRSPDCPMWKSNMDGDCNGADKQYMQYNCPLTCDFCEHARAEWEKKQNNPTTEPDDTEVHELDAESIEEMLEVTKDDSLILLEFFAPWCGHCQKVAPAFRDAAKILSSLEILKQPVILAKFDDSEPENHIYRAADSHKWNITSYPSMFLVGGQAEITRPTNTTFGSFPSNNHEKKVRYLGGHGTDEIVFHMTKVANGMTQRQALEAWHEVEMGTKPGIYKEGVIICGRHESKFIMDLNQDNFVETVLRSDDFWIIEYYSDTCPICDRHSCS